MKTKKKLVLPENRLFWHCNSHFVLKNTETPVFMFLLLRFFDVIIDDPYLTGYARVKIDCLVSQILQLKKKKIKENVFIFVQKIKIGLNYT